MGKILCATRGGEASYKAQDAAIDLAIETGDELLFIFVVDTRFLDKTERAVRRDTVEREMDHMGEFLLVMALERANKKGIKASMLLEHGEFTEELIQTACNPEITTVVLGKPTGDGSLFSQEDLEAYAQKIESETGTKVVLV
jgi:nucleotide-binding universal stress UspA family protein